MHVLQVEVPSANPDVRQPLTISAEPDGIVYAYRFPISPTFRWNVDSVTYHSERPQTDWRNLGTQTVCAQWADRVPSRAIGLLGAACRSVSVARFGPTIYSSKAASKASRPQARLALQIASKRISVMEGDVRSAVMTLRPSVASNLGSACGLAVGRVQDG